jgi:hypothetical protein
MQISDYCYYYYYYKCHHHHHHHNYYCWTLNSKYLVQNLPLEVDCCLSRYFPLVDNSPSCDTVFPKPVARISSAWCIHKVTPFPLISVLTLVACILVSEVAYLIEALRLQAARSPISLPVISLDFLIDLILPAALWA